MSTADNNQPLADDLTPVIYDELRRIARLYFRNLRPGFTLCPTELVNEACLHMLQHGRGGWTSPEHFRALATRKIWQVIVDHLKYRTAAKRGGTPRRASPPADDAPQEPKTGATAKGDNAGRDWQRQPLEALQIEWHDTTVDLLDLADALDALGRQSDRLREVVMLHWFGGMKHADVAQVLGISSSSAEKDFRFALAWLNRRLVGHADAG